ncbi:hypothetical protein [Azospirillum griseum]|uniref:Uncharacterized protein n=1 Tax=Azospirillum griseum TaxID=2496639 RepID=A0A3S0K8J5_9PROT|nr:hypothetical protein [Azospirillum griseum]RTR16457.1 hypothetical protein EJ903_20905 [Azospirillum griseum]
MSIRQLAPALVALSLLATPAVAAEGGASSSWAGTITTVVVGGAIGAVALPYALPVVAPVVGNAVTTAGAAVTATAPAVGALILDSAVAAGTFVSSVSSTATTYVLSQPVANQAAIGGAAGAVFALGMR